MSVNPRSSAARYGLAFAASLFAAVVQWLLDPHVQYHAAFAPHFLAIVIAAWFGGVGPAVLALVLSVSTATMLAAETGTAPSLILLAALVGLTALLSGILAAVSLNKYPARMRAKAGSGQGGTFTMRLPLEEDLAPPDRGETSPSRHQTPRRRVRAGYGEEEDYRRSWQAGFDEHAVKPLLVAQLEAVLANPHVAPGERPPEPTPSSGADGEMVSGNLRQMKHDLLNTAYALDLLSQMLPDRHTDTTFIETMQADLRREVVALREVANKLRAMQDQN